MSNPVIFGAHLRTLRDLARWEDIEAATEQALYRALDIGGLVALAGAGLSKDYGYPLWPELATAIVNAVHAHALDEDRSYGNSFERQPLTKVEANFLNGAKNMYSSNGLIQPAVTGFIRTMLMRAFNIPQHADPHPSDGGAEARTSVLDYCQRLYERRGSDREFHRLILRVFEKNYGKLEPAFETAIQALVNRLQIRRFISTNYDDKIEGFLTRALDRDGGRSLGQNQDSSCPTLNRLDATLGELVTFAMGVGNYQSGVLYLHGRLSSAEQTGLVLTEGQYQQTYMKGGGNARDLREVHRLLFNANSILFAGFSLEDSDAMRPMREFVADNELSVGHQPWFALHLLKRPADEYTKSVLFHKLYYRFGLRTIFVEHDEGPGAITNALVGKIKALERGWQDYRRSRTAASALPEPRVESFTVIKSEPAKHMVAVRHYNDHIDPGSSRSNVSNTVTNLKNGNHALVLIGRQGEGKGRAGLEFALQAIPEGLPREPSTRGPTIGFFATSHFSNDFISSVAGATRHLGESAKNLHLRWTPSIPYRQSAAPSIPYRQSVNRKPIIQQFFDDLVQIDANCIMVFGGFERLLRNLPFDGKPAGLGASSAPLGSPDPLLTWLLRYRWGRSMSPEIRDFLNRVATFAAPDSAPPPSIIGDSATERLSGDPRLGNSPSFIKLIVITSSVVPGEIIGTLSAPESNLRIRNVGSVFTPDNPIKDDNRPLLEIRILINNNLYASDVLFRCNNFIQTLGNRVAEDWTEWLNGVEHQIRGVRSQFRPTYLLGELISWIGENVKAKLPNAGIQQGENPITSFKTTDGASHFYSELEIILGTLSFFTTPIEPLVLSVALSSVAETLAPNGFICRKQADDLTSYLTSYLIYLHESTHLVLAVSGTTERYTTHPLVRQALLRKMGGNKVRMREPQHFDLRDFASEPGEIQPLSSDGARCTLQIFDGLVQELATKPSAFCRSDHMRRRGLIRGAFGILRAGWSATGLGRLLTEPFEIGSPAPVYQHYHRRLARLLTLVYEYSNDTQNLGPEDEVRGALYEDERVWLYNELGLVCYCRGAMPDSYTYFRISQRLARGIDNDQPGYRSIEALINLAVVWIDRGRIGRAMDCLVQAASMVDTYVEKETETKARIFGFLGLIAHLSGDWEKAKSNYRIATQQLHSFEAWRGVSIFNRHYADLLRQMNKFSDARRRLDRAISAAETGFHPDLLHYCRVSEANLARGEAQHAPEKRASVASLQPTLRFAEKIGSAKLESDVYRIKGLIEVDQGDFDAAMRSTLACLWISKSSGLRLRVISSLALLGQLMGVRRYSQDAISIYRSVIRLCQESGYIAPADFAERALAELEK